MTCRDIVLLAANAAAGVGMVFILKTLLAGDSFNQGTTLCALHYISCFYFFGSRPAAEKRRTIRLADVVLYAVAANFSIVTLTWSLKYNELFVYQISKIARVPVTCVLEYLVFRKAPTIRNTVAGFSVVLGVAVATFNRPYMTTHTGGVVWALLALFATCLQQVLVRSYHLKYSMTSRELLAQTSHAQAISLVLLGPVTDRAITGKWLWEEKSSPDTVALVILSCAVALATNWSQFACLRRLSASSFQILGHAKTLLVLLGGWLLYGDDMSASKLLGCAMAALGLGAYARSNLPKSEQQARQNNSLLAAQQGATINIIQEAAVDRNPPLQGQPTVGTFLQMFPTSPSGFMVGPATPNLSSPKKHTHAT